VPPQVDPVNGKLRRVWARHNLETNGLH
jgi:hypothetical protein